MKSCISSRVILAAFWLQLTLCGQKKEIKGEDLTALEQKRKQIKTAKKIKPSWRASCVQKAQDHRVPRMPCQQLQHHSSVGWRDGQCCRTLLWHLGKVQESTGFDRPWAPMPWADSAPPSRELHLGSQGDELSYTRRACALPSGIGVFMRKGDKVMHPEKKHVFLSAEQLLCHSSEQKQALLTGRTQPCSHAHEDTAVPAPGPGTEAHTAATVNHDMP